jgi:tRNA threonylcarbamoyladenosine biosynthesis protein TsaB
MSGVKRLFQVDFTAAARHREMPTAYASPASVRARRLPLPGVAGPVKLKPPVRPGGRILDTRHGGSRTPLQILALESSGKRGTVAALVDGCLLHEQPLSPNQRSAQSLVPAMIACLQEVGWSPSQVDLVAVTSGPGSFTGLRVGVTAAKTFAYAADCEVLGIDTLRAVAARLPAGSSRACAVIDAQRQQLVAGWFRIDDQGHVHALRATSILDRDVWLSELTPGTIVTGTGLAAARGELLERLPAGVTPADASLWEPRAATVGILAWREYQAGRRDDLWKLVPNYHRKSAAEEKWAGRG